MLETLYPKHCPEICPTERPPFKDVTKWKTLFSMFNKVGDLKRDICNDDLRQKTIETPGTVWDRTVCDSIVDFSCGF